MSAEPAVSNEFGRFRTFALGSYDAWKAPPAERDRFTGRIVFTHHGSTSSDVAELIYVNGRLKRKDWGFLPG